VDARGESIQGPTIRHDVYSPFCDGVAGPILPAKDADDRTSPQLSRLRVEMIFHPLNKKQYKSNL
jgi:hypothetical protein